MESKDRWDIDPSGDHVTINPPLHEKSFNFRKDQLKEMGRDEAVEAILENLTEKGFNTSALNRKVLINAIYS